MACFYAAPLAYFCSAVDTLAEAKLARQTEGVEAELLYLYRIDPAIRSRVREMIDTRRKAA